MDKKTSISEGIFWVLIGGAVCGLALRLDLGSFHQPGAGFVAFLSGLFAGAIGLIMVGTNVWKHAGQPVSTPQPEKAPEGSKSRLPYTMALLVAYAVLMDPLGYILSTLVVMFGLFFDWEKRNVFWSSFFSVATTVVSYFVFELWLRCQLPRGLFPWW